MMVDSRLQQLQTQYLTGLTVLQQTERVKRKVKDQEKRGRLNERDFAIIIELVIGSLQVGEAINRELGVEELGTGDYSSSREQV